MTHDHVTSLDLMALYDYTKKTFNTEKSLTTSLALSSTVGITEGGVSGVTESMGGASGTESAHLHPNRMSVSTIHSSTFILRSCKAFKMNDKRRPQPGDNVTVSIFSGSVALGMRNDTDVRTSHDCRLESG